MDSQFKFLKEYLDKMTKIQVNLLELLENEEKEANEFIKFLLEEKVDTNLIELNSVFHLILRIFNNHNHTPTSSSKLFQILSYFQNNLKENFINSEIFTIFRNNKKILLFLFEQQILIPDERIATIISTEKFVKKKYPHFFLPEFKPFFSKEFYDQISKETDDLYQKNPDLFIKKRKLGENDGYICELIRNDSIEEFISYISKNSIQISTATIKPSIFETNKFLIKKEPTLIEYAAFYGSITIFNYLKRNQIELKPSLWQFSIHSNNSELIDILENNKVSSHEDDFYKNIFIESIKCHHNNIKDYIKDNYYNFDSNQIDPSYVIVLKMIKYCNYISLPENITDFIFTNSLIESYNMPFFELILPHTYFNLNDIMNINKISVTPLQYAAKINNIELVQFILKQPNIDVNIISECDIYYKELRSFFEVREAICVDKKSALNMAIDNGDFEIALLLLEHPGIFPNVTSYYRKDGQYQSEFTPLQRAIELGNYDIVKLLLSKSDVDVNVTTSYKYGYRNKTPFSENQRTALHIAIEQKNHAILKLLLQRNEIDVNAKYVSMHYANMRTCRAGDFNLTRAKRKDYNNYERYELYYAINNYHDDGFKNIDVSEFTPLQLAVKSEDVETVSILLSKENIDINCKTNEIACRSTIFIKGEEDDDDLHEEEEEEFFPFDKQLVKLHKIDYNDEIDQNQIEKFENTVNDTIKKIESLFDEFDREIIL